MRPVNLIPKEQQRGSRGLAGGRTGLGVYLVLGALGLAVIGVAASVLTSNRVNSRTDEVVRLESQAAKIKASADALRPYGTFAQIKQARVDTVNSLVDTSFNWERVIRALSRTIPSNVWLTSFKGTVSPDVRVEGGSSSGAESRSEANGPAISLTGCTYSHSEVARMMVRMRNIDDVTDVKLSSSEKSATADPGAAASGGDSAAAGGGASGGECRTKSNITKFEIQVILGHARTAAAAPEAGAAPSPVAAAQGTAATASSASTGGGQ